MEREHCFLGTNLGDICEQGFKMNCEDDNVAITSITMAMVTASLVSIPTALATPCDRRRRIERIVIYQVI